jgi:hypothetical protein
MTDYQLTVIPAEDLNKIAIRCEGCKAQLILEFRVNERTTVKLLHCAACQTEFSREADDAVNKFFEFRRLSSTKKVQIEFLVGEPRRSVNTPSIAPREV